MITYYFTPLFSGAGKQALNLSMELVKNGCVVDVMTHREKFLARKELIDGITVKRFPSFNFSGRIGRYLEFLINSMVLQLFVLMNRNFDVLHIHGSYGLPVAIIARLLNKKIVYKATLQKWDDPEGFKNQKFIGMIRKSLLKLCDNYITISSEIKKNFLESNFSGKKIKKIPNFVNPDKFYPVNNCERNRLRKMLGIKKNCFVGIYSGFMGQRKGITDLIEIWKKVVSYYSNSKLILIGPHEFAKGTMEERYISRAKKMIRKYHIDDKIHFLGYLNDISNYLKVSDVFLFCSYREGSPSALLEAMSSGLTVITYSIPGITDDLINDGKNGFIIQNRNEKEFVKKIKILIKNNNIRKIIGKQARNKMLNEFAINSVIPNYLKLYEEMLEYRK
jgi:glycosyltransferase involved in cell wall biosynthesis